MSLTHNDTEFNRLELVQESRLGSFRRQASCYEKIRRENFVESDQPYEFRQGMS